MSAGKLPDGLTLDGVTGKITGKPTKSASFSFTVEARNTAGVATANYTLKVTAAGTTPSCTVPRKVPVFTDVAVKQKFYAEIDWMHCMKLSTGYADKTYRPKTELSREAMAAFMYRLEAPKGYKAPAKSPFSDVPTTHKFYKEIAWMKESKLSTGYADGTYRPKDDLSREAMAAFIYRLEASDTKSYQAPAKAVFADVAMGQKFSKEIAWMKESKLSTGYADGSYRPKDDLSREAMAAFIYRLETAYRS
ncbi:hypothetical protein G7066_02420 [Leucobacter coleopterorum]|uniref:SLH domain-containing protein n=1 Tax=Leucobacter coleopterorum TaxID=2714933 RepID=A0ABX6JU52_9MICO|nr:S-layer homology domain-containing protein [Leucobacter coleopterorum]QIM17832.1 hypothetical protein G7066_02420 [Leucobacter coleopterorum]